MNDSSLIVGAAPAAGGYGTELVISNLGPRGQALRDFGASRVFGQDHVWDMLGRSLTNAQSGLRLKPNLPIVNALLLGSPGTGKTMAVEQMAYHLIDRDATTPPLTRIPCADFALEHSLSDFTGSSKGLIGSDKLALLAQWNIGKYDFWAKVRRRQDVLDAVSRAYGRKVSYLNGLIAELYIELGPIRSVLLWDEIEKAHPNVWNLLLHIMGDGEIRMSGEDGSTTYFDNTVNILTGNIGSREQQLHLEERPMGFRGASTDEVDLSEKSRDELYQIALKSARNVLPPALMSRIGERGFIVFNPVNADMVRMAIDQRIAELQEQVSEMSGGGPRVIVTPEMIQMLQDRGFSQADGMRHLDRVFEDLVVNQLSIAFEDVGNAQPGRTITVSVEGSVERERRGNRDVIKNDDRRTKLYRQ